MGLRGREKKKMHAVGKGRGRGGGREGRYVCTLYKRPVLLSVIVALELCGKGRSRIDRGFLLTHRQFTK